MLNFAYPYQKFQDWFTQQWVILWGKKIKPQELPWLFGPFGDLDSTADNFVYRLAKTENLTIHRDSQSKGLLTSIKDLDLTDDEMSLLPDEVVSFYEKTGKYELYFRVTWNPIFKFFGAAVNHLFSNRLKQLYIPTQNLKESELIKSEIITLSEAMTKKIKYTIWYRTLQSTGKVIFSGVYGVCQLPSGKKCVKATFPLPYGNATVILEPKIQKDGSLLLASMGKKFGDAGFYFLLKDSKNKYWAQYVKTFHDNLLIKFQDKKLIAEQSLSIWGQQVLKFHYKIEEKF